MQRPASERGALGRRPSEGRPSEQGASPFDLDAHDAYAAWRAAKLAAYPATATDLVVPVRDPRALASAEHAAIAERIRRCNMAVYAGPAGDADKEVPRALARQFGLERLDANWLADEDGISSVTVRGEAGRGDYIPYTDRPIRWHTDGYYNPPERRIRAMVLHCVAPAREGGENAVLDHEMAYLAMRDADPEFVRALSQDDAMTIPARSDGEATMREAATGPVWSVDPDDGALHMRYTARTRSIEWKDDPRVRAAVAFLDRLLAGGSPHVLRLRLAPGMGIVCNNVLHDRSGFVDDPARPRLIYRARYHDRIVADGR